MVVMSLVMVNDFITAFARLLDIIVIGEDLEKIFGLLTLSFLKTAKNGHWDEACDLIIDILWMTIQL